MESLAAGFLSIGLKQGDRVLVAGSNHSQVMLCALACSRAGLVFSLANPNYSSSYSLKRALELGEFQCIVCFRAHQFEADHLNNLLLEISPELMRSRKGQLKSELLPKLTHVILAEEDHKHAGTFTLSEVFLKSSKDKVAKLPDYSKWSSHKLACLQFTLGTTGAPKLIALSHYQMLNGARAVAAAFGINDQVILIENHLHIEILQHVLACALPIFRIAIFNLVCLSPFLTECRIVFPDATPLPKNLFSSVSKYRCTTLLSNGAALRLLLKISQTQRVKLSALENILLIGDRVSKEVLKLIKMQAENVKIIAVGYLLTETGSIPLMGDQNSDFTRNVGKAIAGYEAHLIPLDGSENQVETGKLGKLLIRVYYGSTFMGYAPDTKGKEKWVDTGDIARMDENGAIEVVASEEDLIYDKNNCLVEHWNLERLLNQNDLIKGVQVVSRGRGQPVTAVCVARSTQFHAAKLKDELKSMCRSHHFVAPDVFAFVDDFPRVHTKIQKFRIRAMLESGQIAVF
uniref:AMP-binding domain-containing protein n=1 Tax=Caenorhabditis tropicalis TaxID=1561998 RepID=A0A1I7T0W2_9PELO